MSIFVQILCAGLCSMGFAILYRLRLGLLPLAALGGVICWSTYLVVLSQFPSVFWAGLCSSAVCAFYAEVVARLRKAPSALFFLPSVLPLVPGGSLYYAVSYAIQGETALAWDFAKRTVLIAFSIAAGASFVWAYSIMHRKYVKLKEEWTQIKSR